MRGQTGVVTTLAVAALMTCGVVTDAAAQRSGSRPRNPSSSSEGRGSSSGGGGRSPSRPSFEQNRPARPSSFESRRQAETPPRSSSPRPSLEPQQPSWRSSSPSSLGSGSNGSRRGSEGRPDGMLDTSPSLPSLGDRLRIESHPGLSSSRPSLPGRFSRESLPESSDRPANPSARRPRPDVPGDLDGDRHGGSHSRPLPWYGYRPPVIWGPPPSYYSGYSGYYGSYHPYYSPFYSYDRYNRYWYDPTFGFYPNPPDLFPDINFISIYGASQQASSTPRTPPPGIDLGGTVIAGTEATPATGNLLLFPDYRTEFVAKKTLPAPFAPYGVTPPFVAADAVLTSPWAYDGGRDAATVLPWEDTDAYVRADETRAIRLRAALNSLSSLWEDEDVRALRRYVGEKEPVALFAGDRYLYAVTRDELTPLVVDLLEGIETITFRITGVTRRTDGLVTATAQHRYRVRSSADGESGREREMPVRMTLVYRGGEWILTGLSLGGAS